MVEHPRYRAENGERCIDIAVSSLEHLFDNRDPAPFRERDLDPDVVEYLIDAAEDLAPLGPFRIVLWFPTERAVEEVTPAFRAYFAYELQRLDRERRRQSRSGQLSLLLGVTALVVLLSIASIVARMPGSNVRDAIGEGLVILSWVLLWRPVDALIYDWLPPRRQRKLLSRLHDAPIDVRVGKGPAAERAPQRHPPGPELATRRAPRSA